MKTKHLILIVLMSLVGGFLLHPVILPCREQVMDTDTVYVQRVIRDTIYKEVPKIIKETHIGYDTIYTTIFEPVKIPADTAQIIHDYNTLRAYSGDLVNTDSVYIHLDADVAYNRLFNVRTSYEFTGRDRIITNTVYRNSFYYGLSVSLQREIEANLAYQREKNIYMIGVDPINRDLSFCFLRSF